MTTLRFTSRALADLDEIWTFVAQESEYAADLLMEEFSAALERVLLFPHSTPVLRRLAPRTVRRVNVRSWAVLYRLEGDAVLVLRVVHGGRDMRRFEL